MRETITPTPRKAARVLALETSTADCSAALYLGGELRERLAPEPLAHSRYALRLCEELLAEAGLRLNDLHLLCFGCGPGSFIGLRVAAGVAQGLAYATGIPLAPVSSLAALAQAAPGERLLCATDARMGELYWAAYRRGPNGAVRVQGEEALLSPKDVPQPPGRNAWLGVGDAWEEHGRMLRARLGERLGGVETRHQRPRAAGLLPLALESLEDDTPPPPEQGLPRYLRDQVAHPPGRIQAHDPRLAIPGSASWTPGNGNVGNSDPA